MSFAKFASLITKEGLWFANVESFTGDDPFEAMLPQGNYAHRQWTTIHEVPESDREAILKARYTRDPSSETPEIKLEHDRVYRDRKIRQAFANRRTYFANCWHLANHESAAMWKVYGEIHNAVAVVTDLRRIDRALPEYKFSIQCGKVSYIDFEATTLDISNGFTPLLHKRESFEYENEVRLLIWDTSIGYREAPINFNGRVQTTTFGLEPEEVELQPIKPGLFVPCDVRELISEIRISPTSDGWFEDVVKDFCKALDISAPISRSDLTRAPVR